MASTAIPHTLPPSQVVAPRAKEETPAVHSVAPAAAADSYQKQSPSNPDDQLAHLTRKDFLKTHDTQSWWRSRPDGEISLAEAKSNWNGFVENFLRLSYVDQNRTLEECAPQVRKELKSSLQSRYLYLQEDGREAEAKHVRATLQKATMQSVDNETSGFHAAIRQKNLKQAKAILAQAGIPNETHLQVDGQNRISLHPDHLAKSLGQELTTKLSPQELHLPEQDSRQNREITAYIEESQERSAAKAQQFGKRFEQVSTEVLDQITRSNDPKSDFAKLQRQFPGAEVEIIGTAEPILVGMTYRGHYDVNRVETHHHYRVHIPTESGSEEVREFLPGMTSGGKHFKMREWDRRNTNPHDILSARRDAKGFWNLETLQGGLTPEETLAQNALEDGRQNLASFVQSGDEEIKQTASRKDFGSFQDYLNRHYDQTSIAQLDPWREELRAAQQEQMNLPADASAQEKLELENHIAGLRALTAEIEGQQTQRESLEQKFSQKLKDHEGDWQPDLHQVPVKYVDAITGVSLEVPLFHGKTRDGTAFVYDVSDGGVYRGGNLEEAMTSFCDNTEYGVGYVKYSTDQGQTVSTRATYDMVDEVFNTSESVAGYVGYSAIAAGLIPSPDPVTKGYAAVAGTVSMGVSTAAGARRAGRDWWHERKVDKLDVVAVASSAIPAGAPLLKNASRLARTTVQGTGLALDVAQVKMSTDRLKESLDLNNPNLSPTEREERYARYIRQAGVNAGLSLLSNRHRVRQGLTMAKNHFSVSESPVPPRASIPEIPPDSLPLRESGPVPANPPPVPKPQPEPVEIPISSSAPPDVPVQNPVHSPQTVQPSPIRIGELRQMSAKDLKATCQKGWPNESWDGLTKEQMIRKADGLRRAPVRDQTSSQLEKQRPTTSNADPLLQEARTAADKARERLSHVEEMLDQHPELIERSSRDDLLKMSRQYGDPQKLEGLLSSNTSREGVVYLQDGVYAHYLSDRGLIRVLDQGEIAARSTAQRTPKIYVTQHAFGSHNAQVNLFGANEIPGAAAHHLNAHQNVIIFRLDTDLAQQLKPDQSLLNKKGVDAHYFDNQRAIQFGEHGNAELIYAGPNPFNNDNLLKEAG